jgi:hypothetical protein
MEFTVGEGKISEGFRVKKYPHGLSFSTTTNRELEANMRETLRSRPMWISSSRIRFSLSVSLHTSQLPFPSESKVQFRPPKYLCYNSDLRLPITDIKIKFYHFWYIAICSTLLSFLEAKFT